MTRLETTDQEDLCNLWKICAKFIESNEIRCPESIEQMDHVAENSPDLIEEIAKLVGYHEEQSDDLPRM